MKKWRLLICLLFIGHLTGFAQGGCRLRITLLTCAPGAELYSTFGHTALRVQDTLVGVDVVYNYGTFAFAPDFYAKFVRGQLLYSLAVESFAEFMYNYREESRSVVEQTLNLSCAQKDSLFAALQANAQPEARDYRYDFLFDNCTTRARDMVARRSGAAVAFGDILEGSGPSFRDLIYIYLNKAHQDWGKLGIDLLLGAKMDRQATNSEAMFLPDNLLKAFDGATAGGKPLVIKKETILPLPPPDNKSLPVTPGLLFSAVFLVYLLLSFSPNRRAKKALAALDFLLFFLLGLVGVLLVLMWTATDHALCANNYNLLWAVPTHVVAAFFLNTNRPWVTAYFKGVLWLTGLLLLAWAFLPQHLNPAFLPLVAAVGVRSFFIANKKQHAA